MVGEVATQTARLLKGARFDLAAAHETAAEAKLHEYFPIWQLGREELHRLRRDSPTGISQLRDYLTPLASWLFQLHRGGQPIGYIHARQHEDGTHRVTRLCQTSESSVIAMAIEQIDGSSLGDDFQAGILECPAAGLAAILLMPKAVSGPCFACLYRHPNAHPSWQPGPPLPENELIQLLLASREIPFPALEALSSTPRTLT
jgi:hypothetical protein